MTDKAQAASSGWRSGLSRNVVILGFVSLLNDGASEMIYPLLPVFLTAVLGAGPAALGIVEGVAEATASLLKLYSGYLSDRVSKRKGWIVAGYSLSNIIRPLIALSDHVVACSRASLFGPDRQGASHFAPGCDYRGFHTVASFAERPMDFIGRWTTRARSSVHWRPPRCSSSSITI